MKKKLHSCLSLLLSLSLCLSLCAPAAQAADSFAPDSVPAASQDVEADLSAPEEPEPVEEAGPASDDDQSADDAVREETGEPGPDAQTAQEEPQSTPEEPAASRSGREEAAEHLTVRSAEQLSDFVAEQFTGDYFHEAVVDTKKNRVTVDGTRTTVEDAFGAGADETAILKSASAAEAYFEDTPFETQSVGSGKVVVTAPWQTCRIVVTAKALREDYSAETVAEFPKYHQFVLQFPDEETTRSAYEALSKEYPCYVDEVLDAGALLQDDGETWGCAYMGMNTLKSSGTLADASAIQVAVIDSGCWMDSGFFAGRSISAASKSFPDNDGPFIDTDSHDSKGNPTGTHGTHVAGILHTCTPANVELMILRVVDRSGNTTMLLADTALKYALENGADVINFSLGMQPQYSTSPSTYTFLDQSLSIARELGVPVVCSAGNYSQDVSTNYPACSPDTIAVSAIDRSGQFVYNYYGTPDASNLGSGESGSSFGEGIDFCAPGLNVVSAGKSGTISKNGTSMSAPHITAALAWLRLEDPTADWDGLYNRLKGLCTDLGESGWDQLYGWGCPNLSTLATVSASHTHHWIGAVTTPTCISRGYTVYTCTGCHLVRMGDYVGPVHSFESDGKCTQCGKRLNSSCGDHASWSYSSATETLTITGSGTVTSASWENLYPQQFIRRVTLSGITALSDGLFSDYLALENVSLGSALTELGKQNFCGCTSLKTISLPKSLTAIGAGSLRGCTALTELVLPGTLSDLGDGALCGCTALKTIDCRSSAFTVKDKCLLYSADMTRLIACGGTWNGGTLTVPGTVTQIGAFACEGVQGITELRLSPALSELGEGAFRSCANLKSIYARSSVTTAGTEAFEGESATVYVSEGCTGWENHSALGSQLTWESYPGDVSRWTMSLSDTYWTYTGEARRPGIDLVHGDIHLKNYTDGDQKPNYSGYFTYSYVNNRELGLSTDAAAAPTATITGTGIYYGSQSIPFTIALAAPRVNAPVHAEQGITVSWESVTGADWYQVLRRDVSEDGVWINLPGAVTQGSTWTDLTPLSGHSYTYSVCCYTEAYKSADKSIRARYRSKFKSDQPSILFLGTTQLSSAELVNGDSVALHWSAVDGAASYRVLYAPGSESAGEPVEWTTLTEGITALQWTHSSPAPGTRNFYAVQAVAADGTEGAVSALLSVDCPAVPVLLSAANEGTGVRVKWQKYEGAARYRVLCRTGSGSWKAVADTSATSALVKTYDGKNALKTGKTYTFTVRCLTADGKSYATGCDEAGRSALFVCAPALSSVKNVKRQKLTAAWKKVTGVTGYQVQLALNSKFTSGKKTANLKGAGTLKHTFTGLKKKKTCYVRMRSYKTVSGKTLWSTWSKTKKVTIKK